MQEMQKSPVQKLFSIDRTDLCIMLLLEKGVDAVFYPCLTYNIDEGNGDNHYNCPIVISYSEVIKNNIFPPSKTRAEFFCATYDYFKI